MKKDLTYEQIEQHKMIKRENFKNYDNLTQNKMYAKSNEEVGALRQK